MDGADNIIGEEPGTRAGQAAFGERRFGAVNWLGLWTLYVKEVRRFMKVVTQTVVAPVISTLLFLIVFTQAFGSARPDINGVPFVEFLAPGLIMMAVLTNAFTNSSSSILIAKVQGSIVDVLMPPLSPAELTVAFVAGAVTRGFIVGFITAVTSAAFMFANGAPMRLEAIGAIVYFATAAALIFAMLGVIGGIWAEKFDQLAAVTNFVITPLTFLSGTFYSVDRLPEPFRTISQYNPVYYLIDGFRSGFTGHAESSLVVGVGLTFGLIVIFGVGESAVRGRVVRLAGVMDGILQAHQFPDELSELVGEAACLVAMMGAALKFDGKLIFQAQGDGPASLVVADYTAGGGLRATGKHHGADAVAGKSGAAALLGKGHIAMTIDQGPEMERYQGVTPIEGDTLGAAAVAYFRQSEQIPTIVKLAVGRLSAPGQAEAWRAGGVMLQYMPGEGGVRERGEEVIMGDDDQEIWDRAAAFVETIQDDELLDPSIAPETLLYRLFHEDGVRVYDPQSVHAACGCNGETIAAVLARYTADDLKDMVEDGAIKVTCEFCRKDYRFSASGELLETS
ncbi:33 kDa chaperonin (Heat shock protein 33 homolog) (HSP33) [Durusdinium trenchii]|uniref:33 kDa chaperonin (Heat shock protein 33 homolog) (HSP33) n=1 Tax=Durusdinium trenchii TaxID=1381693 RepID=A0ABP0LV81_9DINO